MNQKSIDELKAVQESLEKEGTDVFNDNTLPYNERQEGLEKYKTSRKMLNRICDLQHELNIKHRKNANKL